jgi:hypothetical protein
MSRKYKELTKACKVGRQELRGETGSAAVGQDTTPQQPKMWPPFGSHILASFVSTVIAPLHIGNPSKVLARAIKSFSAIEVAMCKSARDLVIKLRNDAFSCSW